MSLGWFEKKTVGKTVRKVIGRVMRNVDQTIKKHPGLSVDEALKIVDRQQGVFFPGEKNDPGDLKSLFALIVWKGYRNIHLSDPDASSAAHRELVYQMVFDYLHDRSSASQPRYRKVLKPATVSAVIGAVLLSIVIIQPFYSKAPATNKHNAKDRINPASSLPDGLFKYHGYASNDQKKLALVNKSIYHEGDLLDEKDGYVLKSIYPRHIVIRNRHDQSEFSVVLQ